MSDQRHDDAALEALFDAARAAPPEVPDALMARVLADAEALQPATQSRGWRGVLATLGGLPVLGGLVAATCVGFWIGVAPPDTLPDIGGLVLGAEAALDTDSYGFGWDIEEG